MTEGARLSGIWSAVLTPLDESLEPDASLAVPYYGELLENGCDGLNLLGTTGEAMSFSAAQRVTFMEAVASSGLPVGRMMAGTGAASLADAVRQTRSALDCGFGAVLIMPPFFFRDAVDAGVVRFFDVLLRRSDPPPNSVLLYNFPAMSGVSFTLSLVNRLMTEFGDLIAGMKDSSNDGVLQSAVLAAHPALRVFPGSESDLREATGRGAAGCISGSVALWPELARKVYAGGDGVEAAELRARRAALMGFPFVPAVRCVTAQQRNEPRWITAMPPQTALDREQQRELLQRVSG